jgi:hypothetical protein
LYPFKCILISLKKRAGGSVFRGISEFNDYLSVFFDEYLYLAKHDGHCYFKAYEVLFLTLVYLLFFKVNLGYTLNNKLINPAFHEVHSNGGNLSPSYIPISVCHAVSKLSTYFSSSTVQYF